ncbi:MAG: AmmeMemoRadiSam system protein A [Lachnospiraceae bacterium]|nr:AmmeMemoRadiSam system protein A [Lachnospiraceae bacterium]
MSIISAYMVPHPPLIVPEIGKGQEQAIEHTIKAYHEAAQRIGREQPDTIILFSPHQVMYSDYFHISPGKGAKGDFSNFRAGNVKMEVSYDTEFIKKLCELTDNAFFPAGTDGEREKQLDHGTMVPLYFVNQYWKNYKLVRIGLSGLPLIMHYELGTYIRRTAEMLDRKVILIASGDLSHRLKEDGPYGYRKEGPEYDRRIMDVMERGAFGELLSFSEDFCEKAGECGHRSFTIMAGALDKTGVLPERLSYEGSFGVGYGICCYKVTGSDPSRDFRTQYEAEQKNQLQQLRQGEDCYIRLARTTIDTYVRTGNIIDVPQDLDKEMSHRRAGVFVSIKEDGRLRGCIGTIQAVQTSIAEEIIANAISASTEDPRFSPIEPWELDRLTISVDVLGEKEKIDSPEQLDPKRYGVIVTKGHKRGLLLPNLEGIDTVEEQIAIAKRKAGIRENDPVELERFEVIRHEVAPTN